MSAIRVSAISATKPCNSRQFETPIHPVGNSEGYSSARARPCASGQEVRVSQKTKQSINQKITYPTMHKPNQEIIHPITHPPAHFVCLPCLFCCCVEGAGCHVALMGGGCGLLPTMGAEFVGWWWLASWASESRMDQFVHGQLRAGFGASPLCSRAARLMLQVTLSLS
jgi:hypothetical protein